METVNNDLPEVVLIPGDIYCYSPSNNAFYHSSLFSDYFNAGAWPDDAFPVEDSVYQEFAADPAPEEMTRIAGGDGMPTWEEIPRMVTAPAQAQAQKDALLKKAGGEIEVLRDVVEYSDDPEKVKECAAKLEEWRKYRAAVYTATPGDAVNIPLPG